MAISTMPQMRSSQRRRMLKAFVRRALRQNAMFLFLSSIYILVALVLSSVFDIRHSLFVYEILWISAAFLVFVMAYVANSERTRALERLPHLNVIVDDSMRRRLYRRIALAAPVFIVFPLFISSFTSIKASIGEINPYDVDHALMVVDRFLHGGVSAWRIFHPFVGYPAITAFISLVYEAWFPVLALVVVVVAMSTSRIGLRNQFLVALVLTWAILGTLFPLLLPAGGPCFYGLLYPDRPDPYRPLMEYLAAANEIHSIRVLDLQQMLWADFEARTLRPGSGISATPSMHVAIAMLIALYAWRIGRKVGFAATVFVSLTFVATVHLGWHYAVDGYISMLGVPLIWRMSGRLAALEVRGDRLASALIRGARGARAVVPARYASRAGVCSISHSEGPRGRVSGVTTNAPRQETP